MSDTLGIASAVIRKFRRDLGRPPRLQALHMTKHFGGLCALDDVSLTLEPGTFHALLGENGAGKSTLVKCVMGYHHADEGRIIVGDRAHTISSPRDAHALGIGMVYQHFTLVANMTVAENLLLARADLPAIVDWKKELTGLQSFLAEMPFRVDVTAPIVTLAAGEKQKVEILKQLYLRSRILILDEPTSVLTPNEADQVLGRLRELTQAGVLSVLLITHKLREVKTFAEVVSVLRRGRLVGQAKAGDVTPEQFAELMVGRSELTKPAERVVTSGENVRLQIEALCADDDRGAPAVSNLSLLVRSGEILGIAGVSGNGQRELVEVLAGQREATLGAVFVHGERYRVNREEIRRRAVVCLPEEPMHNACVRRMTLAENLALRDFDRPPFVAGRWFINRRAMRKAGQHLITQYRIIAPGPDAAAEVLSGGNVQRMVLARDLSRPVEVLIVANPCFGLDIASTAEIRAQIMQVRNRGAAVLLVSEDLDELFELADRMIVMFSGRVVYETLVTQADRVTLGRYMVGH
jgi:general nucleoside transport system ATP-binding protein